MRIDGRRPSAVVMHREVDRQRRGTDAGQFGGPDQPVVPIGTHPCGERKSEDDQERRDRPTDRPETGVTFADVVDQGRHDAVGCATPAHDDLGGMKAVSLISRALGEEHLSQLLSQPLLDDVGL